MLERLAHSEIGERLGDAVGDLPSLRCRENFDATLAEGAPVSLEPLESAEHRANVAFDGLHCEPVVLRFAPAAREHEDTEVLRVARLLRHRLRADDALARG